MFIFLSPAKHDSSCFDVAVSGLVPPPPVHSSEILAELARILRPGGKLILQEKTSVDGTVTAGFRSTAQLISTLKLSGFVSISEVIFNRRNYSLFCYLLLYY